MCKTEPTILNLNIYAPVFCVNENALADALQPPTKRIFAAMSEEGGQIQH